MVNQAHAMPDVASGHSDHLAIGIDTFYHRVSLPAEKPRVLDEFLYQLFRILMYPCFCVSSAGICRYIC